MQLWTSYFKTTQNYVNDGFKWGLLTKDLQYVKSILFIYKQAIIFNSEGWIAACGVGIRFWRMTSNHGSMIGGRTTRIMDRWIGTASAKQSSVSTFTYGHELCLETERKRKKTQPATIGLLVRMPGFPFDMHYIARSIHSPI